MADTWVAADAVAKNDKGEFVARFGDKWEPVAQAAKSDDGKFVVIRQSDGFGKRVDSELSQIPRQLGLTARYGLEGAAGIAGMLAEPFRLPMSMAARAAGLTDRPLPNAQELASRAADAVGLPSPETPRERIVGEATKTMAGAAVPLMPMQRVAETAAGAAPSVASRVSSSFVANPGAQLVAGGAAGGAGAYAKETGGGPLAQFASALGAGVGAGAGVIGAGRLVEAGRNALRNFSPQAQTAQTIKIDLEIKNAIGDGNMQNLPQHVLNRLREDVKNAMDVGNLKPDAIRRLADYRMAEATPTRAGLTLDPIDITRQRNAAKAGANSSNENAQMLARLENENARRLASGVQELAGNVADDAFVNSERALSALKSVDESRRAGVSALYERARDSLGRAAPLDPAAATRAAGLALAEKQAAGLLPEKARSYLNDIATGKIPFNVDTKEQIVRNLGTMMRSAPADEAYAIGLVRKALDDAPLLETQGLGPDALEAFKLARAAHAGRIKAQERTPALAAAADGVQPDQFFQQYVVGNNKGNVQALNAMKEQLGEKSPAFQGLRGQLIAYLKRAGSVDESKGTFNQAGFNNALDSIGDAKLSVFFSKEELAKLRAIGRVASYEQVQPRGSAVNNANSAATILGMAGDAAKATGANIPLVGPAARELARMIQVRTDANRSADIPNALAQALNPGGPNPSAALPISALLSQAQENERERNALARGK